MMRILVGLATMASAFVTLAQTACPVGVPPGDPRCGPSPAHHGEPSAPRGMLLPEVPRQWGFGENHGAVVRHDEAAAPWLASGFPSYRAARRAAKDACTQVMGRGCKVALEVKNALVAIAVRDDGRYFPVAGSNEETARDEALQRCRSHGGLCDRVYVLKVRLEITPAGRAPTFSPRVDNLNEWPSESFAVDASD